MLFTRIILLLAALAMTACSGTLDAEGQDQVFGALDGSAKADAPPTNVSTRRPPPQPVEEPDVIVTPEPEPTQPMEPTEPEPMEDPSTPGLIVEFRIPAGTAMGTWNSMETAPLLYVGQILRIVNEDTIAHQLHVPSGGPFRHGQSIPPGAQVEYLVEAAWPLETQARMYDHQFGNSAGFWMQAVE